MASNETHRPGSAKGFKFLELSVYELQGVQATPAGRCEVQVTLDGKRSRTGPGENIGSDAYQWRADDDAGYLFWRVRENDLLRLQVHEPRLRLDVLLDGDVVGTTQCDLRDLKFRRDSSVEMRKAIQSPGFTQSQILFSLGIRTPSAHEIQNTSVVSQQNEGSTFTEDAGDLTPLGVALGEEHVLIGSSGQLDMTLYITLLSLSSMQPLARATQGTLQGFTRFWVEYHIFGVQVETEAFPSLKFARFAPIRDSFQLRSCREDVARFLKTTPIRVYLCCAGEDTKQKRSQRLVLASTLLTFSSLLTNEVDFSQVTSNCAFSLEAHAPYELTLNTGEAPPSLAVSLELHVDGKVPKVMLDESTGPDQHEVHDESIQTDGPFRQSLVEPKHEIFQIEVLTFELEPLDDEDDRDTSDAEAAEHRAKQGEGSQVYLVLSLKDNPSKRAQGREVYTMEEYGQVDQTNVAGLHLNLSQQEVGTVFLECRIAIDDSVFAIAELDPDVFLSLENPIDIRLLDYPSQRQSRGSIQIRCRELPSQNITGSVPVPRSPMSPISTDKTVYNYRITIDLRSIKGLEKAYNVYLQYMYPLFGMTHTIQTRPPILVDRFSERIVPHGLNLFQFKISRAELDQAARSEPLVVEMWHRDQYAADSRLGFCALPLRKLLEARSYFQWSGQTFANLRDMERYRERFLGEHAKADSGLATAQRNAERLRKQLDVPPIQVQVLETDLVICAFGQTEVDSGVKRIATVRCTCTLENLGSVEEKNLRSSRQGKHVDSSSSPQQRQLKLEEEESLVGVQGVHEDEADDRTNDDSADKTSDSSPIVNTNQSEPIKKEEKPPGGVIREDHASSHAYDHSVKGQEDRTHQLQESILRMQEQEQEAMQRFQRWKEEETRRWEAEMRNRESTRMSALEQEWAHREHERAKTIKLAQEEYKQLEVRMHRAITDAERRERAVARLETELQRAADQRLADIEVLHRRAREESQHKITLHQERVTSLESELKRVRVTLGKTEQRLSKVESEYADFREKTRQSPEATLQKEIAMLQGQNAELHARLEQEKERTASEVLEKEKVKAQLVQVARELQRQMHANNARAERELDNLRLEYLAREERYVLDGDRKQLMDLRQELNELRAATLRTPFSKLPQTNPLLDPKNSSYADQHGRLWQHPQEASPPPSPPTPTPQRTRRPESKNDKLERLLHERDELLRTGVYNRDHPLVVQLEEHIEMTRNSV